MPKFVTPPRAPDLFGASFACKTFVGERGDANLKRRDGAPIWVKLAEGGSGTLRRVDLSKRAESAGYDEAWLQTLLHRHPEVFPLSQIESGLGQPVSTCRELPVVFGSGRSGQLDNFYITTTGALVIIEAKLWRNPEARRSVVAQAMEYASTIFRMSAAQLEETVRRARAQAGEDAQRSLYELIAERGTDLDEPQFYDTLSRNLRLGRAVVAVVGDGIREDILPLAELLQGHAGERFTFALVELGVFETPHTGELLVLPSILAQTTMVERGVVKIEEREGGARVVIEEPPRPAAAGSNPGRRAIGIGEDEFYDLLGQRDPTAPGLLRDFLERAAALGIRPDRQSGLSLKHAAPEGNDLNFGTISKDGYLDTGPSTWFGRTDIGHRYNETLAKLIGGMVREMKSGTESALRTRTEKTPRLTDLLPTHADAWLAAIETYLHDAFEQSEGE